MRLGWIGLLTVLGVLAVLPVTMTASGLVRWDERGSEAAHHADSVVLGRVSPWPVNSDEQEVAIGFGVLFLSGPGLAAVAVHRRLRRRLAARSAPAALLGVAVWCIPSVLYWLTWPAA
jgi:hypothetical protein